MWVFGPCQSVSNVKVQYDTYSIYFSRLELIITRLYFTLEKKTKDKWPVFDLKLLYTYHTILVKDCSAVDVINIVNVVQRRYFWKSEYIFYYCALPILLTCPSAAKWYTVQRGIQKQPPDCSQTHWLAIMNTASQPASASGISNVYNWGVCCPHSWRRRRRRMYEWKRK